MDIITILQSRPVLIGLHLGVAIIGIDAFLWLSWQLKSSSGSRQSRIAAAAEGLAAFTVSWITGGYYYVVYYGTLVKPLIKSGVAPWAHGIIMETKEHIFLFIIPLAATALFITLLEKDDAERLQTNRFALRLSVTVAALGLLIGVMGFVISAAARWGTIS